MNTLGAIFVIVVITVSVLGCLRCIKKIRDLKQGLIKDNIDNIKKFIGFLEDVDNFEDSETREKILALMKEFKFSMVKGMTPKKEKINLQMMTDGSLSVQISS